MAWFGGDEHWQYDFVRWMILAIEEPKESPEQSNIDIGLDIIKKEIDEIIEIIAPLYPDGHSSYRFYLVLLTKCKTFVRVMIKVKELNY